MNVILYMATSANGYIAKKNHETPWSDDEFDQYKMMVESVGNLIIGRTTYDLMLKDGSFETLGNPVVICLTSQTVESTEKVFFVNTFDSALNILQEKNFTTALVGGGGQMDTVALNSGLIDEIYLDIEPHIFGDGIQLFVKTDRTIELRLNDIKKIGEHGVQLHYKVIKHSA